MFRTALDNMLDSITTTDAGAITPTGHKVSPLLDFAAACEPSHRLAMLTHYYFSKLQDARPSAGERLENWSADEDKAEELANDAAQEIRAALKTTKRS